MSNELDLLMSMDPLQLSDQNIEEIIAYQRQMQANFEAGIKAPKASGPKKDLRELLGKKVEATSAQPTMRRRV